FLVHTPYQLVAVVLPIVVLSSCTITVTGYIGQDVTLPCSYDVQANGIVSFCWGHGQVPRSKCSNTVLSSDNGDVTFRESPRYQLLSQVMQGDFSLTIVKAQETDSGVYGCRVEIPGLFNDQKINVHLIMEEVMLSYNNTSLSRQLMSSIVEDSIQSSIPHIFLTQNATFSPLKVLMGRTTPQQLNTKTTQQISTDLKPCFIYQFISYYELNEKCFSIVNSTLTKIAYDDSQINADP
uniref:Ig-like domain-containing protein n=1 Tax=Poecilia mexicana TaxID=48701 RepID=A0A3B3WC41_9TELE